MTRRVDWTGLAVAVGMVALATLLGYPLEQVAALPSVAMVYLLAVAFVSGRYSKAASVSSAVLSVASFSYFFEHPRYSVAVSSLQDAVTLVVMLSVGLLINSLAAQLKRNAEEASHAAAVIEREKARGDLLSAVSHDLRTPLATIEGSASALLGQDELSEQSRQLATSIQVDSQRMAGLVSNLLDMTRMQGQIRLDLDWYALDELVANAVLRTEAQLDNPVQMTVHPDVPLVRADGVLVEQVFVNLLENASRHAGKSTHVTVEIGAGSDAVWAHVIDDGPGIPRGAESKMFERFWGSPGKGAGLGLAICRAAMLAHGGTISASNLKDGGACFRLEFPTRQELNG